MTGYQKVDGENTDRDNRFIKNWKDIFFKCICKNNIKSYFKEIKGISSRFDLFTTNRNNGESRKLISDAVEVPRTKKKQKGF